MPNRQKTPHPAMDENHKECPKCLDNGVIYLAAGIPNKAIPCPLTCVSWDWLLNNGKIKVCNGCGFVVNINNPCPFCNKNIQP